MTKVVPVSAAAPEALYPEQEEGCPICHNSLEALCIVCEAESNAFNEFSQESALRCRVDLGDCGHNYHTHCMSRWLRTRKTCGMCDVVYTAAGVRSRKVVEPVKDLGAECGICRSRSVKVVYVPCGHIYSCVACAELLKDCPCCRVPIQKRQEFYLAVEK